MAWGFQRRRRRASPVAILLFVAVFCGYEWCRTSLQKAEAWSGQIERSYSEHSFWQKSNSTPRRYWDVRSPNGELHTIRVHTYSTWSLGSAGDAVVKAKGQLDPAIIGGRSW